MKSKKKIVPPPGLPELMRALKFTDADLKANRDGLLSRQQRRRILIPMVALIVCVWGFAGVLSLYYLNGEPFHWWKGQLALFGCTSIYGLVFLGTIATALFAQKALRNDLNRAPVLLRAIAYPHKSFGKEPYFVRFKDKEFNISREAYEAFREGMTYEIYYTTHDGLMLLTAVPVKPDPPYPMN